MCFLMPSFTSTFGFRVSAAPNNTSWTSADVYRPALRTTTSPPFSSHSNTDPGRSPSFFRISAGTEIWPWAVTLDCAIDMPAHYSGNARRVKSRELRLDRLQRGEDGRVVELVGDHHQVDVACRSILPLRHRAVDVRHGFLITSPGTVRVSIRQWVGSVWCCW